MRIQHNIMAMNAYRNYNNNTSALSKNLEKLSSGMPTTFPGKTGDNSASRSVSDPQLGSPWSPAATPVAPLLPVPSSAHFPLPTSCCGDLAGEAINPPSVSTSWPRGMFASDQIPVG